MADNATLKSQYLAQIQADLERTAKEKERIAGELASLQQKLTNLEQDHALLVGVQEALAGSSSAAAQDPGPAPAPAEAPEPPRAAVPRPRKPKAAPRAPGKAARKPAAKDGDGAAAKASAAAPTLVELVVADLAGSSEPRSAAEVTTALAQAHPGRKIQSTVVRNALE